MKFGWKIFTFHNLTWNSIFLEYYEGKSENSEMPLYSLITHLTSLHFTSLILTHNQLIC
jgi:hypothetical protein